MRRSRWITTLLVVVPVAAVAMLAGWGALRGGAGFEPACRVLPNGIAPVVASRGPGCPLEPYDRILALESAGRVRYGPGPRDLARAAAAGDAIRILVSHRGVERWLEVPVAPVTRSQTVGRFAAALLVSALVMATALLVLWGSAERAAEPFARFYGCVCIVLLCTSCRDDAGLLALPGLVASGLVPATLGHLALTFPREREVLRRSPQLVTALYGLAALLVLIAAVNHERAPTVWAAADRLVLALALASWILLLIGCVLAAREADSPLERARARTLLWGSLIVPGLPLAVALGPGAQLPGGSLPLLTIAVALLPLPVGCAISRYRLFDLAFDLRRAISYLLSIAAGASVVWASLLGVNVAVGTADPLLLFAVAFAGLLAADPLRARLRGAVADWMSPEVAHMARRAREHVRETAALCDPHECARILCETVGDGLDARGTAVFLRSGSALQLAHARGEGAPLRRTSARAAEAVLGDRELACLPDGEPTPSPARAALAAADVELVAGLRSGSESMGVLLVTASRRRLPYTSLQLGFVRGVSQQSAAAIHNANLAAELLAAERLATQGRLGTGLIHDLGKPLGVVEHLGRRLARRLDEPDAATIADLAAAMRETLRSVLDSVRADASREAGRAAPLGDLIDRAVRFVARTHGSDRVCVRLAPGGAGPRVSDTLVRVLVNLLDNALLASRSGEVVEVTARPGGSGLVLEVVDRGDGMQPAVAARAFDAFFTTRRPGSGTGLGLAICRDLVEDLGGRIDLHSAPGRGTRVRIELPAAGLEASHAA